MIVTVVGTFTHHRWGREAVWRMLRGIAASLFAFVVFFLVVGLALPVSGLIASYVLAAARGADHDHGAVCVEQGPRGALGLRSDCQSQW